MNKGLFILFIHSLIIVSMLKGTPPPRKKAKSIEERVDSCGTKSRQSTVSGLQLIEDDMVTKFSESCELLYWCMTSEDEKYGTTVVPF